jgi:hypothetical protein
LNKDEHGGSEFEGSDSDEKCQDPMVTMLEAFHDDGLDLSSSREEGNTRRASSSYEADQSGSDLKRDRETILSTRVAVQNQIRTLLELIDCVVENRDESTWAALLPHVTFDKFCLHLNDFFMRNLPSDLQRSSDNGNGFSATLARTQDQTNEMTKRPPSARKSSQSAKKVEPRPRDEKTIEEHQAEVQTYTEELVKLEQQLLKYVDNPVETVKLQIKIKQLERELFDAKTALHTADTKGEFRREVRELREEIDGVKSRQSDVEK